MVNELMADDAFVHAIEQHEAFYFHYDGAPLTESGAIRSFIRHMWRSASTTALAGRVCSRQLNASWSASTTLRARQIR